MVKDLVARFRRSLLARSGAAAGTSTSMVSSRSCPSWTRTSEAVEIALPRFDLLRPPGQASVGGGYVSVARP